MNATLFTIVGAVGLIILVPFTALGLFTWDTKNNMLDRAIICLMMTSLMVLMVVAAHATY